MALGASLCRTAAEELDILMGARVSVALGSSVSPSGFTPRRRFQMNVTSICAFGMLG